VKYLLVFLVVFLIAWRWRSGRSADQLEKKQSSAPPPPADMVSCAHCGLHVPAQDAVAGKQGSYCSAAHRAVREP
jgi:uncharacterized protein